MKAHTLLSVLFLSSTLPLFTQAQHTKNEELAIRITTSVANIKPGETILLEGGIDQIQLMEALAEQTEGFVTITMGGNDWDGGTNKLKVGFTLPIEKATVSIDRKVVVNDEKLLLDKLTSSK